MTKGQWQSIFGGNLASILREKGVSQAQLSRDTGIARGAISDYVNKFSTPGLLAIINIAYALDVDVDELIDFGDRIE